MSEQQPLYHQSVIYPGAGGRINDPTGVPVPYLSAAGPRLDTMNLPPGSVPVANSAIFSPYYAVRPTEPGHLLYRHVQPALQPQYCNTYCFNTLTRPFHEAQLPNQMATSVEYQPMGFASQPYSTTMYPTVTHGNQPLPNAAHSAPRSVPISGVPATAPRTAAPRSCALEIKDPVTGALVDLKDSGPQKPLSPPVVEPQTVVPESDEAAPIKEISEILTGPPSHIPSSDATENEPHAPCDTFSEEYDKLCLPVTGDVDFDAPVVENGLSPEAPISKKVIDDFIEAESGEESDSDVEDVAYRRIYPRDFLLTCKDSPVAKVPLQELATYFADYSRPRKGHRASNRAAQQRIIRLPTGITVKRVEGAFVPSHLRQREGTGEVDRQKVLSRELNVILNRVSDGNMPETIADIKKLNISSQEDIQLLSKLVFQKSIRQPKYSKVFASLCRELKGFEVSACEPFEGLILRQAQELFHTPLETLISELNAALDAKIAAAKDDAVKRVLEDGRDTNIVKKTEAYYGNITFLAELFLCRMVTLRTMTKCLNDLKDSSAPEAINSMLILLRTCGQELEQQAKNVVDNCFSRLSGHMKSNKLPTHQVYKIQELIDLRERGWKDMNNTHAPPQPEVAKRPDEKVRWSFVQPTAEPKRKPAQSVNPLTPSSLAVTQQSLDSRKLGPTRANWSQGSGLLSQGAADDREGGPRASVGLSSAHRQPGVSFAQSLKPKDDYESIFKRHQGSARSVLTMLKANEDSMYAVFEECRQEERSALLHCVLESLMDASSELRNSAGIMCLHLLNKKILSPKDLVSACGQYLPNCNEDWLEDYPLGWRYLAEIFQHLIQEGQDYFSCLLPMLKTLKSDGRGASVIAYCLQLSAKRLSEDCVAAKFRSHRLDWTRLGVTPSNLEHFVNTHSVQFTLSHDPLDAKLKELNDLAACQSVSQDQLAAYFKQLSNPDLPLGFVRLCARTLIMKSKGLSRPQIDHRVSGLGILIDHDPEREMQVLQAVHEFSGNGLLVETWHKSLLDKKVISTEAWDNWSKSSNSRESVPKNFPMRNK